MSIAEYKPILLSAATDVLESMCFVGVIGAMDALADVLPGAETDWLAAGLEFRGPSNGSFGLSTSFATARNLACNFLGEDESAIDRSRAEEVLCELANMICGYFLGLREGRSTYDLSHPQPLPALTERSESTAFECFELEEGCLCVWMNLEPRS